MLKSRECTVIEEVDGEIFNRDIKLDCFWELYGLNKKEGLV